MPATLPLGTLRTWWGPKAPDAIMAELWAFKRQANAGANYDIRTLLKQIERVTQAQK